MNNQFGETERVVEAERQTRDFRPSQYDDGPKKNDWDLSERDDEALAVVDMLQSTLSAKKRLTAFKKEKEPANLSVETPPPTTRKTTTKWSYLHDAVGYSRVTKTGQQPKKEVEGSRDSQIIRGYRARPVK